MANSIARIPDDILHSEILPWLPDDILARFKSACKRWHHLITQDSVFTCQHSRYNGSLGFLCIHGHDIGFLAINDLGKLDIYEPELSFSYLNNGTNYVCIVAFTVDLLLLLLQRHINTFHYVWNLVTNEGHAIPESDGRHNEYAGLAFNPSTSLTHYRLVKFIKECRDEFYEFKFKIYSSDTGKSLSSKRIAIYVQRRHYTLEL
ncbi:hypothetical protein MUK42_36804 [Musa troglodytarum]|uniref:F-box domain-containing protein n=1 Tax=Musa troglodytarum TaxID=320322 RepID=A0A9E7GDM3_9LILI|nr:hypothetical protein MUK42_36804 [Musa troglodytarum]